MARKKRRNDVCTSKEKKKYRTAIYARLSLENSKKEKEKDVIANQIEICKEYIEHDLELLLVETYIDNGRTGTNFDRPEFNKLMEEINKEKIDCIVVRDLSRFGRDYIEIGTYIEQIFPKLGVRFVSVKEGFDTQKHNTTNSSIMIPLQNLINGLYSKDISRKVSTAHRVRMEGGNFKRSTLPYGYMLDETRTKILIDAEVAKFVVLIYSWKLEGETIQSIIGKLEELNAPSVLYQKNKRGISCRANVDKNKWSRSTIERILSNPTYKGDTVLGRTERSLYKGVDTPINRPKSEWTIYENTHEAIISREIYNQVQEVIEKNKELAKVKRTHSEKKRAKMVNLFEDKIVCADCLNKMYHKKEISNGRWISNYICSSYVRKCNISCSSHRISSEVLEKKVLSAIKRQVSVALDYEKLLYYLRGRGSEESILQKYNSQISSMQLKKNTLKNKRTKLYEDFVQGILDEAGYEFAKRKYDLDYVKLNRSMDNVLEKRKAFQEIVGNDNPWFLLMKSITNKKKLTQDLVEESIEKILISQNGNIEIVMKYADVYGQTVQNIKRR